MDNCFKMEHVPRRMRPLATDEERNRYLTPRRQDPEKERYEHRERNERSDGSTSSRSPARPLPVCSDETLASGIWATYRNNQQSEKTFKSKISTWKCLDRRVKASFPNYGLYLVGSTISGFGTSNSDLDMCLLIRQGPMNQRTEALIHLENMLNLFRQISFVKNPIIIPAKVPLLKFDVSSGFQVDLNCNNFIGIRNTHLLYCYSQLDWRVRPLVLTVKVWAQRHGINDPKNMSISSYSLTLMVIHYLQCGITPPVLPCLHSMYPEKFSPMSDVYSINIQEKLHKYVSKNPLSLSDLLQDFFGYYSKFDFVNCAISVRLGHMITVAECRNASAPKNHPNQWHYLCIEEPFDQTNTALSVYDYEVFEKIKRVICQTYNKLWFNKKISAIFP